MQRQLVQRQRPGVTAGHDERDTLVTPRVRLDQQLAEPGGVTRAAKRNRALHRIDVPGAHGHDQCVVFALLARLQRHRPDVRVDPAQGAPHQTSVEIGGDPGQRVTALTPFVKRREHFVRADDELRLGCDQLELEVIARQIPQRERRLDRGWPAAGNHDPRPCRHGAMLNVRRGLADPGLRRLPNAALRRHRCLEARSGAGARDLDVPARE